MLACTSAAARMRATRETKEAIALLITDTMSMRTTRLASQLSVATLAQDLRPRADPAANGGATASDAAQGGGTDPTMRTRWHGWRGGRRVRVMVRSTLPAPTPTPCRVILCAASGLLAPTSPMVAKDSVGKMTAWGGA